MRNWYDRTYIVIHAPISERAGRTFERKLAACEDRGFVVVGNPTFHNVLKESDQSYVVYGSVLMRKQPRGNSRGKI